MCRIHVVFEIAGFYTRKLVKHALHIGAQHTSCSDSFLSVAVHQAASLRRLSTNHKFNIFEMNF